ncbi:hypothetical protein JTB14_038446 [Gonioctena quinquepunctata]|nr:hypothetical protein JTB14_038446 [Gonioctena quinquepunctata]
MEDNAIPGPSGVKKLSIKNPKALTDDEIEWSGAEEQAGDFAEDFEPVESDSDNPEVQIQTPADITWVENPAVMRNMPFSGQQGLKVNIPGEGRPIDFFTLLADDDFFYFLQKKLSIDDSMLLWRGRLMFRQYIKNKKDKYGIKFYLLTESNGTIMKIQIYTGAADDMGGKGHATKIVLNLANNYLDQGYSLYMDNFYNSVDLARQLLERNTYCTGTLRNGRKGSPSQVKTAKLKSGESVQCYSRKICVVKWKDEREVLYISTEHENVLQEVTSRSGRMGEKPLPIAEYNEYMSGIDLQDQMMAYYPSHRKTIRWYKKVGIHIIEMMLYNSFMIYNKHSVQKMSYLDFRQSIIDVFLPESAENVPVIREAHHYPSKCDGFPKGLRDLHSAQWSRGRHSVLPKRILRKLR